jgi:hypothetical protein
MTLGLDECPAGTFFDTVSCIECSTGTYSSASGQTSCMNCPSLTYADAEGSSVCTNCVPYQRNDRKECTHLMVFGWNSDVYCDNTGMCMHGTNPNLKCPIGTYLETTYLNVASCVPCQTVNTDGWTFYCDPTVTNDLCFEDMLPPDNGYFSDSSPIHYEPFCPVACNAGFHLAPTKCRPGTPGSISGICTSTSDMFYYHSSLKCVSDLIPPPTPTTLCPAGQYIDRTLDSILFTTQYYDHSIKLFDSTTGQFTRDYGIPRTILYQRNSPVFNVNATSNNFVIGAPSFFAQQFGNSTKSVIFDQQFCQMYLFDKVGQTIKLIAGNSCNATPPSFKPGQDFKNASYVKVTDGIGTQASFAFQINWVHGLPSSVSPDLTTALVYDTGLIRKINIKTGEVKTLAGVYNTWGYFFPGYPRKPSYGAGSDAVIGSIMGMSLSSDGSFALLADPQNNRIHFLNTTTGNVSFVTGHPQGYHGSHDGQGTDAILFFPSSIAIFNNDRTALFGECGNFLTTPAYNAPGMRFLDIKQGITTKVSAWWTNFDLGDDIGMFASLFCPINIRISSDESHAIFLDYKPAYAIRKIDLTTFEVTTIRAFDRYTRPASFSNLIHPVCALCPSGTYTANQDSKTQCNACPAGTFAPQTGGTECILCTAGTFYSASGASACILCKVGSYSSGNKAAICDKCSPGTYSNTKGFTVCTTCSIGSYSNNNGSTACKQCGVDAYILTTGASACLSCLSAPLCSNGQFRVGCSGNSLGNCASCYNT